MIDTYRLIEVVNHIIAYATHETTTGNLFYDFEEIKESTGVDLKNDKLSRDYVASYIMEQRSNIVADMVITEDGFDLDFYLDCCPNYDDTEEMEMSI